MRPRRVPAGAQRGADIEDEVVLPRLAVTDRAEVMDQRRRWLGSPFLAALCRRLSRGRSVAAAARYDEQTAAAEEPAGGG